MLEMEWLFGGISTLTTRARCGESGLVSAKRSGMDWWEGGLLGFRSPGKGLQDLSGVDVGSMFIIVSESFRGIWDVMIGFERGLETREFERGLETRD